MWPSESDHEGTDYQEDDLALGAGQDTPEKVLCQYLGSMTNYVKILSQKYFDSSLNVCQDITGSVYQVSIEIIQKDIVNIHSRYCQPGF